MFAPQRYHNALQNCEKPRGDWQPATYPLDENWLLSNNCGDISVVYSVFYWGIQPIM